MLFILAKILSAKPSVQFGNTGVTSFKDLAVDKTRGKCNTRITLSQQFKDKKSR
jgi:hypothetical protein